VWSFSIHALLYEREKIIFELLLTHCFVSTVTNSMKCLASIVKLRRASLQKREALVLDSLGWTPVYFDTKLDKALGDHRRNSDGREQTNKTQNFLQMCLWVSCQLHSDQAHRLLCFNRHIRARGAAMLCYQPTRSGCESQRHRASWLRPSRLYFT